MPAPRTCRDCRATLPTSVRWCGQCFAPVVDFAPREPLHRGDYAGALSPDVRTSRWRASPTTFGPFGRVVITAGLVLILAAGLFMAGPTPFGLWFLFGWTMLAALVLRSTWAPVRVEGEVRGPREWLRRRFPTLGQSLPAIVTLPVAAAALIGVAVWASFGGGPLERFLILLVLGFFGWAAIIIWLTNTR